MALNPEHKSNPNIREAARWVRHHWKPVGLVVAGLAGAGYSFTRIVPMINPQFLDQPSRIVVSGTPEPPSKLEPQLAAALEPIPPEVPIQESIETRSPAERIAEARAAQQEALARGESRIPIPGVGEIKESNRFPTGEQDLFVVFQDGQEDNFPALAEGQVTEAARVNRTTKLVEISSGNETWMFHFPLNSDLLVSKGQSVTLGSPMARVKNDSNASEQIEFEKTGAGRPKGTVAIIVRQKQDGSFDTLSVDSTLLRATNGELVKIPSIGS